MRKASHVAPRVLVLGATGFIGQAVVHALLRRGHRVRGLARKASGVAQSLGQVEWRYRDIAALKNAEDWRLLLADCAAVVNLAGALQESTRDRLLDVHGNAIAALAVACPPDCRLVHVSAPAASNTASIAFYRTKAVGDDAIKASNRDWVILRPVVVLGRDAYGGSALLRALAAFPGFIPAVHGGSVMQTVAMDDVVNAICMAVDGKIPGGSDIVLSEPGRHTLAEVLTEIRKWLGLASVPVVSIPLWAARAVAFFADMAGNFGWRSPLRSTALKVSAEGVAADAGEWTRLSGATCRRLEETLALMPSTLQDRWFARMYLLKPLIIAVLALFWLLSGAIGLLRIEAASATFIAEGVSSEASKTAVVVGAITDMILGAFVLHRRSVQWALFGMIAVSIFYLGVGTILAPELWLDPLGPLLKVIPALFLVLVALAISPER